ncbi:heavy metal translocating P-type ATPase [Candidatus Protochlamydia phocaeensis]|uniref:heavy metal translocating P-type ATPase n=1 Tax=Candidatus Protochlamydia phocaeensis TaxID=1414722 RepID=UPI000838E67A|nr:heavy metal translocating P-type ATPase [Candidatus Protochlamydia phocaeensis]
MASLSEIDKPSPSPLYLQDAYIALLTLFLICLHLLLRYAFTVSDFIQYLPLYAALILGGIPIVFSLMLKFIQLQFSSDLLAGLSIVTAVLLGQYLAGALVVLMLSGGQALEVYAVRRASFLLEALSKRMPNIAHRKLKGIISSVEIDQIQIGDTLVVYPHDICPVDGIVAEGHGIMDESYLTGEPFLISKTPGSTVLSGSINGNTSLTITATKQAKDSRYAKIVQVLIDSEQKKPRMRRLADQLGAFYTPLALLIAIAAWLASGEAMRFLAVLVIATPCPLLIAIPVAIIGSISLCAKNGIVIKNPIILEQIDQCRTIIFDKTGTLTYGKPALTEISCFNAFSRSEVLTLAASVENYSKHPLSHAIIEAATQEKLPIEEAAEINENPGEGLKGIVNHHKVVLTSRSHLLRQGKADWVSSLPTQSGLECVLLIDQQLAAHFRFHDKPRTDTYPFISHLAPKHQIEKMMIVSGDREQEVRYLANYMGITEVYASKTPEEKVAIVETEAKRAKTIYLGDGINDAPALSVATVGLAFGQNSDITSEAADAVVMDNSMEKVDELFHISRRMRTIALQSAVGGIALSLIGMCIAAFGWLPPVAGAIAQEIIDVFAVLNALRVAFPHKKLSDF